MKNLFIIAGPNGAGKTTASYTILPDLLDCREFVNADEIARGLSPFRQEKAAIEAGRLMISRIIDLIRQQDEFAFETTLASRSFVNLIKKAKKNGYFVTLIFFFLDSPALAINRVKTRFAEGGHDVPDDVVKRRYYSGIKNLFNLYLPLTDYWMVINNSEKPFVFIAEGSSDKQKIYNSDTWGKIKQIAYEK